VSGSIRVGVYEWEYVRVGIYDMGVSGSEWENMSGSIWVFL